jgi:flagellar hook assembly protein FlgD
VGAASDTFITAGLSLGFAAGDTITAEYTDPTDPTDVSSDTITIIASELAVAGFFATPNPFVDDVEFSFDGTGIATVMSVAIYDLSGALVWAEELANVTGIVWNGTDEAGALLANGGYIYVIMATDGTNTFNGEGLVFINR